MERRIRPLLNASHEAMLQRIDVAIFDVTRMSSRIRCSQNRRCQMPRSPRSSRTAAPPFVFRKRLDKVRLDQAPTRREVRISRRQSDHCMQVIGQHNDGIDLEGIFCPRPGNCIPQRLDVIDQQRLTPFHQVDRKEPASAGNESATIVWHDQETTDAVQYASPFAPYIFRSTS